MRAANLYIVLGGTGPVGKALRAKYESPSNLFVLIGRSNPEFYGILGDELQSYLVNWREQALRVNLVIACGGDFASNFKLARNLNTSKIELFDRVILFSSLTAEMCGECKDVRSLSPSNDRYGKRHLELSLMNQLDSNRLIILRLGRVINAGTIWDEALRFGLERKLGLPENCVGQITNLSDVYRYLDVAKPGLYRLYYKLSWTKTCSVLFAFIALYTYGILSLFFKSKKAGFRFYKIALDK